MALRLPSVRDPQSFYDVYVVTVAAVVIVAIVLSIRHGSFVRVEMVAFVGVVLLWAIWGIFHVLENYVERTRRGR